MVTVAARNVGPRGDLLPAGRHRRILSTCASHTTC